MRIQHYIVALVIAGLGVLIGCGRATAPEKPPPPLRSMDRFRGQVQITTPEGPRKVGVSFHKWIVNNHQKLDQLPVEPRGGMLVVQLGAGRLTTIIDGRRQERSEGEFWTVPAGQTMAIETGDDSVVLQGMIIAGP